MLGLTGRLDTLQAAILLAKLDVFPAELERRRAIAARYDAALAGIVSVPAIPDGYASAFALYTVRVAERDRVRAGLDGMGREVGDLDRALRERGAPFDALPLEPAVAVNRTYAFLDEPLYPDDEVAFIPPVAGG